MNTLLTRRALPYGKIKDGHTSIRRLLSRPIFELSCAEPSTERRHSAL